MNPNGLHPHSDDDMDTEYRPKRSTVAEALAAIQLAADDEIFLAPAVVYCLAELQGNELTEFTAGWQKMSIGKRRWLLHILSEISQSDFTISFDEIGQLGLIDTDIQVRANALEVLWYDFSETLFHQVMAFAQDPDTLLRLAGVKTLARFITEGELEDFNPELSQEAQVLMVKHYRNLKEDFEVRRRALEAVSRGSHPDIPDMIREAYYSDDPMMQQSALFAMGNTYDEQWAEIILEELESEHAELRFEAVRSAGELTLEQAVPLLEDYAFNEEDYEIRLMAIWSLGEIATPEAQRILNLLAEAAGEVEDEELLMTIEEALENAMLMSGHVFPMFRMDGDIDLDDYDDFDDDDDEDY